MMNTRLECLVALLAALGGSACGSAPEVLPVPVTAPAPTRPPIASITDAIEPPPVPASFASRRERTLRVTAPTSESGPRAEQEIEDTLAAIMPELRTCYATGLSKRRSLRGVTATRVAIDTSGRARAADVAEGNRDDRCYKECTSNIPVCGAFPFGVLGDAEARTCVVAAIEKGLNRDVPHRRAPTTLVFRLLFDPEGIHRLRAFEKETASAAVSARRKQLRDCATLSGIDHASTFRIRFAPTGRVATAQLMVPSADVRPACLSAALAAVTIPPFDGEVTPHFDEANGVEKALYGAAAGWSEIWEQGASEGAIDVVVDDPPPR